MGNSIIIKLFLCIESGDELIGIKVEKIDHLISKAIGYPERSGVYVSNVFPSIVGDLLGLYSGDIILSVKDKPINDPHKLVDLMIESEGIGETVLKVLDRDRYQKVKLLPIRLKKVIAFDI